MAGSGERAIAARTVRRMGFGATGAEVDTAIKMGVREYVTAALRTDFAADPGVRATPLPNLAPPPAPGKKASADQRKRYQQALSGQLDTLTGWWLHRMIAVRQPVQEKLTLVWHNHFATSAQKVRNAAWLAAQNETLRARQLGDFHALAYAMLTDAALLYWLDGQKNTKKAPNENLAREFMELFALGHGNGYTEQDVREAARALTGWRTNPGGGTRLDLALADRGVKTVLGSTGNLDAAGLCDIVLAQPKSAEFLASRMWRQLAADADVPGPALARVVAAYGPGRDLRAMTEALLLDPEFASRAGGIVIGPIEWLVGTVRALRIPVTPARLKQYRQLLKALGQLPFYPPNVGGWPSGQGWLSTVAAETRMRASGGLVAAGDISAIIKAAKNDRVDAAGQLLGIAQWSDATAKALRALTGDPRKLTAMALNTPEYLTN